MSSSAGSSPLDAVVCGILHENSAHKITPFDWQIGLLVTPSSSRLTTEILAVLPLGGEVLHLSAEERLELRLIDADARGLYPACPGLIIVELEGAGSEERRRERNKETLSRLVDLIGSKPRVYRPALLMLDSTAAVEEHRAWQWLKATKAFHDISSVTLSADNWYGELVYAIAHMNYETMPRLGAQTLITDYVATLVWTLTSHTDEFMGVVNDWPSGIRVIAFLTRALNMIPRVLSKYVVTIDNIRTIPSFDLAVDEDPEQNSRSMYNAIRAFLSHPIFSIYYPCVRAEAEHLVLIPDGVLMGKLIGAFGTDHSRHLVDTCNLCPQFMSEDHRPKMKEEYDGCLQALRESLDLDSLQAGTGGRQAAKEKKRHLESDDSKLESNQHKEDQPHMKKACVIEARRTPSGSCPELYDRARATISMAKYELGRLENDRL